WFSESHFESYRRLGLHTVEHILRELKVTANRKVPLEKFTDAAERHVKSGGKMRIPLEVRVVPAGPRDQV
ncbi:MAG TPA: hypothetical protein VF493_08105, partial [Terriglobales bacterium]